VLTYVLSGESCEILSCTPPSATAAPARARRRGRALARGRRCRRIWVLTTNDNLDALRFDRRRGLSLAELHPGAVDTARERLKPTIPCIGDHEIPIRDELVLEKIP
jgi:hypothetical protein